MTRIAVLLGEGRNTRIEWPPELDVRVYEATDRDAKRVALSMRQKTVDAVYIAAKIIPTAVSTFLPRGLIPVYHWRNGIAQLPAELRSRFSNGAHMDLHHDAVSIIDAPSSQLPHVRTSSASKHPERRPTWSQEEDTALIMAVEAAVDFQKVIDTYSDLTSDVDAPARTQAEIRNRIEIIRGQSEETSIGFDVFAFMAVLHGLAALNCAKSISDDNNRVMYDEYSRLLNSNENKIRDRMRTELDALREAVYKIKLWIFMDEHEHELFMFVKTNINLSFQEICKLARSKGMQFGESDLHGIWKTALKERP